jgi:hypothetical protein
VVGVVHLQSKARSSSGAAPRLHRMAPTASEYARPVSRAVPCSSLDVTVVER